MTRDLVIDSRLEVGHAAVVVRHHIDTRSAVLPYEYALGIAFALALVAGFLLHKRRKLIERIDDGDLGRSGVAGKEGLDKPICVYTADTDPFAILIRGSKND